MTRIVIVGGPSRGKSTEADRLHKLNGTSVFCGDPKSKVVYTKPYTIYLPEGLPFAGDGGAAHWVAHNWFHMPGPWICEGHVMARALRRWSEIRPRVMPCEKIIVLDRDAHRPTTQEQEAMHKGVMKVWREIAGHYSRIAEIRR